jgi:hypothetical protein
VGSCFSLPIPQSSTLTLLNPESTDDPRYIAHQAALVAMLRSPASYMHAGTDDKEKQEIAAELVRTKAITKEALDLVRKLMAEEGREEALEG